MNLSAVSEPATTIGLFVIGKSDARPDRLVSAADYDALSRARLELIAAGFAIESGASDESRLRLVAGCIRRGLGLGDANERRTG